MSALLDAPLSNHQMSFVFPIPLQKSVLEGADTHNQRFLARIQEIRNGTPNSRPESWSSSVYTTLFNQSTLHLDPAFSPLVQAIGVASRKFAERMSFDLTAKPLQLESLWFNAYQRGDSQEPHIHSNCVISGSYFVQSPPGSAPLTIYSPVCDSMFEPPLKETTAENSHLFKLDAEPGVFYMWRSWTRHGVMTHGIDEERITLSFNIR